jgi:predicted XRE-type DNA-binding protein
MVRIAAQMFDDSPRLDPAEVLADVASFEAGQPAARSADSSLDGLLGDLEDRHAQPHPGSKRAAQRSLGRKIHNTNMVSQPSRSQYQLGIDTSGLHRYDPSMPRTRASVIDHRAEVARAIGRRLAIGRERAGLSQAEAARALEIPQSQIAKLELGIRQLQFIEGLRLAALYSLNPEELDPSRPESDG